jgi:hypothetical protein
MLDDTPTYPFDVDIGILSAVAISQEQDPFTSIFGGIASDFALQRNIDFTAKTVQARTNPSEAIFTASMARIHLINEEWVPC